MKTKSLSLFFVLVFALTGVSNAQVGRILRNKINQAINKDVEAKIDSAANEDQDEKQAEGRSRGLGIGILGGKTDVRHDDEYKFTGRMVMQMETYDKKGVHTSEYLTYFNANTLNACIEVKVADPDNKEASLPTQFIFDNDNRCFMMLMQGEGSKTGIISEIPDDSTLSSQAQAGSRRGAEEKPAVITKTGNTKIIAGYRCDEYKVVEPGEDGYTNVWMTKDVKIKADKRNWGKAGIPTYYGYPEFEGSMMLAMDSYDKDNKPEMKMETKEINDNINHSVSTVGYSFIKMNFGQAGKK
jgi:hypothetical protein